MITQNGPIKGVVIIQGSLFWEDEYNCLPNAKGVGKERREWRDKELQMDKALPIPFPIRYGRSSSTRSDIYTMVVSKDYLVEEKLGQAQIVPFVNDFALSTLNQDITQQIKELTRVERISKGGANFAISAGAIAIWINPKDQ